MIIKKAYKITNPRRYLNMLRGGGVPEGATVASWVGLGEDGLRRERQCSIMLIMSRFRALRCEERQPAAANPVGGDARALPCHRHTRSAGVCEEKTTKKKPKKTQPDICWWFQTWALVSIKTTEILQFGNALFSPGWACFHSEPFCQTKKDCGSSEWKMCSGLVERRLSIHLQLVA